MTKPSAATAYSRDQAQVYDSRRFATRAGKRVHGVELDLLLWGLGHLPKREAACRVLEIGCGTGRLLVEARGRGYQVDGADASPDMIDKLREKIDAKNESIELMVADAAKLPCEENSYDAVYSIRLLNQTESPEYALRIVDEALRVTKPGGYVLIEYCNYYRPRLGTAAKKTTTRLRPAEVVGAGRRAGGELVAHRGGFFFGMQSYSVVPAALVGLVDGVDRIFSRIFPRLCARSYVLFRKAAGK